MGSYNKIANLEDIFSDFRRRLTALERLGTRSAHAPWESLNVAAPFAPNGTEVYRNGQGHAFLRGAVAWTGDQVDQLMATLPDTARPLVPFLASIVVDLGTSQDFGVVYVNTNGQIILRKSPNVPDSASGYFDQIQFRTV